MSGIIMSSNACMEGASKKTVYPITRFSLGRRQNQPLLFHTVDFCPGKRAKLDNLTEKEKMIRRKMLNREAAQKARDKKRDLMSVMEEDLDNLRRENDYLRLSNKLMREKFVEQEQKFILMQNKMNVLLDTIDGRLGNQIEPPESAEGGGSPDIYLPNPHQFSYTKQSTEPLQPMLTKDDCPIDMFDAQVVEISTNEVENETSSSFGSQPPSTITSPILEVGDLEGNMNTGNDIQSDCNESHSLIDDILNCIDEQTDPFHQPPSTADLDDLLDFLRQNDFPDIPFTPLNDQSLLSV